MALLGRPLGTSWLAGAPAAGWLAPASSRLMQPAARGRRMIHDFAGASSYNSIVRCGAKYSRSPDSCPPRVSRVEQAKVRTYPWGYQPRKTAAGEPLLGGQPPPGRWQRYPGYLACKRCVLGVTADNEQHAIATCSALEASTSCCRRHRTNLRIARSHFPYPAATKFAKTAASVSFDANPRVMAPS